MIQYSSQLDASQVSEYRELKNPAHKAKILKAKTSIMSYKIPEATMNELCKRTYVEGRMETVGWPDEKKFNLDEPAGMIYAKRTWCSFTVFKVVEVQSFGKTPIAFISSQLNTAKYQILLSGAFSSLRNYWCQLEVSTIKMLQSIANKGQWPALSPKLNSIENLLLGRCTRESITFQPKNWKSICRAFYRQWSFV